MGKKSKYTVRHYLKMCRKKLEEIKRTGPEEGKRFAKLKAEAEMYLDCARRTKAREENKDT